MHTPSIGTYELKTNLSAVLERVAAGETIDVTRHGHVVARIVPAESVDNEARNRAIDAMLADRARRHKMTAAEIKAMINEGRRW